MSFERKQLPHRPPDWVQDGAVYFITCCLEDRESDQLIHPEVSERIRDSVAYYQQEGKWWVELLLLMPNHLHALISFNQREYSMSRIMQQWKRYGSRQIGIAWQRGYFDHRIRSEDALREKAIYIRSNPVRQALVKESSAWPHVWNGKELNKR